MYFFSKIIILYPRGWVRWIWCTVQPGVLYSIDIHYSLGIYILPLVTTRINEYNTAHTYRQSILSAFVSAICEWDVGIYCVVHGMYSLKWKTICFNGRNFTFFKKFFMKCEAIFMKCETIFMKCEAIFMKCETIFMKCKAIFMKCETIFNNLWEIQGDKKFECYQ